MRDRIGFIGVGAMGGALIKGLLESGVRPSEIVVHDAVEARLLELAGGIESARDNRGIAEAARVIFLAVKPQDMGSVLEELEPAVGEEHLIVSVAAGVTIEQIESGLGGRPGVIRVMPNTPCLVGEGAMAVSEGKSVSEADLELVTGWLKGLGVVRVVPEKLLDAVTGLSGSGPAYVCLLIEALADGGVLAGLPRDLAGVLAVQTVLGTAEMVRGSGEHPAVLREKVTSPGGTTAAGLFELEEGGVRAAVVKAVRAASDRSKELGK